MPGLEADIAAFEKTLGPDDAAAAREILTALAELAGAGSVKPFHVHALIERESATGASAARLARCKKIGDAWIAFCSSRPLPVQVVTALADAKAQRAHGSVLNATWFKSLNAFLGVLLLIGLRIAAKTTFRSCGSGDSTTTTQDPRDDLSSELGGHAKFPEGWKRDYHFPTFQHFGPKLSTTVVGQKGDGATVELGAPRISQTTLPNAQDDDALIEAVLEPFKKHVYDRLSVATEWSKSDCTIEQPGWIVCGGWGKSRFEPVSYAIYLHIKRFGDQCLVAVFFRRSTDLSKQETVDFVRALDL